MEKETLIQIEPGKEKVQTIHFAALKPPEIKWPERESIGNTGRVIIVGDEPKTEYRFDFTVIWHK